MIRNVRAIRLVELNVIENVYNLCKTSIVQNAWKHGQQLAVHGWVYSISTGKIKDMKVSTSDNTNLGDVFKFE
jgi:carbonic anhydrase